ncbi:MAG: hypothetical protein QOF58_4190, partial [Pseudonocardiales bacterium]|nr:hypothetical protein [Pseudonocardiales bacterium]
EETPERPSVTEKTQVPGKLIGYWTGTGRALIELSDGRTIETVGAAQLEGHFSIGDEAVVYFDGDGNVIGWLLPAVNAGVNLRQREET